MLRLHVRAMDGVSGAGLMRQFEQSKVSDLKPLKHEGEVER